MTSAAEALQTLAADPHYVGGTRGILAVLHTWTRALVYHPHVHCLVPGGGLAPDGATWHPARGDFLVPARALAVLFRARYLTRVKATLPGVVIPPSVWQTPWVVYCKPTVRGSALVLRYLARYVHRVAITDARILALTEHQVTFSYKDAQAHTSRRMTLSGEEFLRRFLQHVLPRGFHKVRYYGLWAPTAQGRREHLQRRCAPPPRLRLPHHQPTRNPPSAARATRRRRPAPTAQPGPCGSSGTSHRARRLRSSSIRHEVDGRAGPLVVCNATSPRLLGGGAPAIGIARGGRTSAAPPRRDRTRRCSARPPIDHQHAPPDHPSARSNGPQEHSIATPVAPRGSVQQSFCVGCAPQKLYVVSAHTYKACRKRRRIVR